MKKLILLIQILLLVNILGYSQTKALTNNGDTVVCFSVDKAKFLLKSYYKSKELAESDSISKAQLQLCDSTITEQREIIEDYENIVENDKIAMDLKDNQVSEYKSKTKSLTKEIKRQKIFKVAGAIISFGLGISLGSLF